MSGLWFFLRVGARVALRRARQGPKRPAWSWRLETLTECLRLDTARVTALGLENIRWAEERARIDAAAPTSVPEGWIRIPGTLGGVPAEWLRPGTGEPARVILFLHGGAYTQGSLGSHRELFGRLCLAAGARGVALDYRLAPEHPFPAAVDDAVAAYRALLSEGVSPASLALVGDSSGGGLCLATLVSLRREGVPLPAAVACLSPWVDLALRGSSTRDNAAYDWPSPELLRAQAALYLNGTPAEEPLASPLEADLSGLPPAFLQVGGAELLLDDSLRLAERLRAAGGEVILDRWDGMIHGWQFYPEVLKEAKMATDRLAHFLGQQWSARP